MSLETKIDIVVKNLNQLNKLSENLKGINASNEKLVKGLEQINTKLDRIGSKGFTGLKRSADSASKSVSNLNRNMGALNDVQKFGKNAKNRALGLGALGTAAIGTDKAISGINSFIAKNGALSKVIGVTTIKTNAAFGAFSAFGSLLAAHPQIAGAVAVALTALGIKGFDFLAKKAWAAGGALRNLLHTNTQVGAQLPQTQKEYDKLANSFEHAHLHAKNLEDAMKRIKAAGSPGMHGNIVRNVGRSKASRAGSGFADFSRRADQVMNTPSGRPAGMAGPNRPGAENAVTKSIRRHLELEAKRTGVLRQTWEIEKKIEQSKKNQEKITKRDSAASKKTARERLQNIRRIRRRKGGMMGGKGGENLMLGAGFPLLFGGGVGSVGGGVGGALLGNKMGMPGFGAQILGSAIGTMMDTAVQKAAKLGESLRTLNMDELVDSGVRLSAELQTQISLLTRAGDIEKARALAAQQVQKQTGASAGSLQDVNNAVNILKSAWNDVVGSVGAFLGIVGAPVIAALGLVLRLVAEIFKSFNKTFDLIRKGITWIGSWIPGLNESVAAVMDGLNPALQESIAKATELGRKFENNATLLAKQLEITAAMPTGNTFSDKRARAQGELSKKLLGFDAETETKLGDLRTENQALPAADLATLEDKFMSGRIVQRAAITIDFGKEMKKIDEQEQKIIGKLERQNELKAALFGIDQKIAQARSDEDKELEFRLNAQKEIASITSKLMEDTAGKDDAEKKLKIDAAKLDIAKVNFALETKIDEFRQKKKDEAEDVLTQLQNENDLLQGKIDGNEEEIKQLQTIEKIVDKIGEGYREQVTTLIEKNGQLKETAKNTDNVNKEWDKIKDTIATGLTNAIQGLIDGTKSLGESLAGIAKQIAAMLIQKAILSAFSSGGVTTGSVSSLPKVVTAAQGAYFGNGIKPFSTGGMATRPTLGLIGEAGESEYIIPASKMAASMQRYSAGARGESVIPSTGSSYAGGGAGGSTTVNYSGPILNFNSEEFVPKSAVGQIIATATSQGAKAGENRTLTTLRNSRSTRSRLGM